MKISTIYQDLKIQFLYFFVAYELFNTNNLKLFVVLFLIVLVDALYNANNIIRILSPLNASAALEPDTHLKKLKINRFLITILFLWTIFIAYVLFIRKDFWITLF
jgi:hypothetical protein